MMILVMKKTILLLLSKHPRLSNHQRITGIRKHKGLRVALHQLLKAGPRQTPLLWLAMLRKCEQNYLKARSGKLSSAHEQCLTEQRVEVCSVDIQ
jgi:hypothetical protein